jgi:hypothetical protein
MSGLLRGACRWPSWVFAYVEKTGLHHADNVGQVQI